VSVPRCVAQKIKAIDEHLNNLFNGVLVHRFRDVSEVIRRDVIRMYGDWIASYATMFAQNRCASCRAARAVFWEALTPRSVAARWTVGCELVERWCWLAVNSLNVGVGGSMIIVWMPVMCRSCRYLKYLGWQFYDRDEGVRLASLDATVALLEVCSGALTSPSSPLPRCLCRCLPRLCDLGTMVLVEHNHARARTHDARPLSRSYRCPLQRTNAPRSLTVSAERRHGTATAGVRGAVPTAARGDGARLRR
jgi:hypothetical protein